MPLCEDYPLLYHAHHNLHPEDLPFWEDLAARWGDPILELGCGTGRVLLPLASKGHQVFGLDINAGMLSMLQGSLLPRSLKQVSIVQADIAAMPFATLFNLILMPCNTLSTLSAETRRRMWLQVSACLAPEGIFAASLPNPELLRRLPAKMEPEIEDVFAHPLDGEPVQVSSQIERSRRLVTIEWFYDHLLPDGQVERLDVQVRHHLTSSQEYQAEISAAGLEVAATYGDYDRSAYATRSPSLILLVQPSGSL